MKITLWHGLNYKIRQTGGCTASIPMGELGRTSSTETHSQITLGVRAHLWKGDFMGKAPNQQAWSCTALWEKRESLGGAVMWGGVCRGGQGHLQEGTSRSCVPRLCWAGTAAGGSFLLEFSARILSDLDAFSLPAWCNQST